MGREAQDTKIDLLNSEASIERYAKRHEKAAELLDFALHLAEGQETARVHHNIARNLLTEKNTDDMLGHAMQALVFSRRFGNRVVLPYVLEIIGACQISSGHLDRARISLEEGLSIGNQDDDQRATAQVLYELARLERRASNLEKSIEHAQTGLKIAQELEYAVWAAKFLRVLAETFEEMGNIANASRMWKELFLMKERERD